MSDDEIIRAMVSARQLLSTGVLNGTVVTTGDVPLEGAIAPIGGRTAVSDARGRFRITGLRLGQTYALSLAHPREAGEGLRKGRGSSVLCPHRAQVQADRPART